MRFPLRNQSPEALLWHPRHILGQGASRACTRNKPNREVGQRRGDCKACSLRPLAGQRPNTDDKIQAWTFELDKQLLSPSAREPAFGAKTLLPPWPDFPKEQGSLVVRHSVRDHPRLRQTSGLPSARGGSFLNRCHLDASSGTRSGRPLRIPEAYSTDDDLGCVASICRMHPPVPVDSLNLPYMVYSPRHLVAPPSVRR